MSNAQNLTPEELKSEQDAMREAKAEEVRANIIEKFGLSEDDNAELIDKLVEDDMAKRKSLSHTIGQKIAHRTEAERLAKELADAKKPPEGSAEKPKADPKKDEGIDEIIKKAFEQRDLESMEYPDELKSEISRVAELNKISIK